MNGTNEIWDEFKWEEFLRRREKKLDCYMELIYRHQDGCAGRFARELGWRWLFDDEGAEEPLNEESEGEEWKARSGMRDPEDEEQFEIERFSSAPLCQSAKAFAARAMAFAESLPETKRGASCVVDFVSNAMIASAEIARGSYIGYELEELGGNIAFCKRGLRTANLSLAALREMNDRRIVLSELYAELALALTEVRNLIALRVLDLRERFRRGV